MPHSEVGVQNDPIHAIIAAAQEILIQSAQPICHGGYARRTPAYFKLPRRGHFFAARSAKKRSSFAPHAVGSYALQGFGLIVTTFDAGFGLSRRNASATLAANRSRRYGFWRTRSPSAGEKAAT